MIATPGRPRHAVATSSAVQPTRWSLRKHPLRHAVLQGSRERAGVFEEAVDGGVTREGLHQRPAGRRVLLASFEEGFDHREVRHEVDEGVTREVLAGPLVPELALVAG